MKCPCTDFLHMSQDGRAACDGRLLSAELTSDSPECACMVLCPVCWLLFEHSQMHEPKEVSMRNYAKTKTPPNDFLFFDGNDIPAEVNSKPKRWSTFFPVDGIHCIGQTIVSDQPDTP